MSKKMCQRCVTANSVVRKRIKIRGRWVAQNLCAICMKMYDSEGKTENHRDK